jgi:hypothetical protein
MKFGKYYPLDEVCSYEKKTDEEDAPELKQLATDFC